MIQYRVHLLWYLDIAVSIAYVSGELSIALVAFNDPHHDLHYKSCRMWKYFWPNSERCSRNETQITSSSVYIRKVFCTNKSHSNMYCEERIMRCMGYVIHGKAFWCFIETKEPPRHYKSFFTRVAFSFIIFLDSSLLLLLIGFRGSVISNQSSPFVLASRARIGVCSWNFNVLLNLKK